MTKKSGKRYTEQERGKILGAAEKQGLNGVQAAKKFGISTLTYYNWKKKANGSTPLAGKAVARSGSTLDGLLRSQVRNRILEILPEIMRTEVAAVIGGGRGTKRSRPRG